MAYHQLTSEERYTIAALRKERKSTGQIARELGRHRSTIWREVSRNSSRHDGGYRPFRAVEMASGRRSRSRRGLNFSAWQLHLVEENLKQGWSPEQISGRLKRNGAFTISHETIYRYVWGDKSEGGELWRNLRCATKQRRKRHNSYDSRGRLAGKRHISERPAEVEARSRIGHWEIDTVVGRGSKDCVATLVERKTGYAYVGKLPDRSKRAMSRRTKMLIRRAPECFDTITSDNGSEFHDYESVEKATGVEYYFATPYHSWERGSNENFNGLLRQYIPKRANQASLTQSDCDAIAKKLNTRPRKRLDYRTPEECFHAP
jgi:IS30 family transposase